MIKRAMPITKIFKIKSNVTKMLKKNATTIMRTLKRCFCEQNCAPGTYASSIDFFRIINFFKVKNTMLFNGIFFQLKFKINLEEIQ